jgi:hypothetical protein
LGTPAEIAATAAWQRVQVHRYGRVDTVEVAVIDALWYGTFDKTEGRTVPVREIEEHKILGRQTHIRRLSAGAHVGSQPQ